MKNISIYILLAIFLFSSCESLEDIYSERDDMNTGYVGETEYTLTSDDYEAIAGMAYDKATTPYDSSLAAFIEAYEHFNDSIKAADFIPPFLADKYPALSSGSAAQITYNYNGEMPAEFEMYVDALKYELIDEDYSSFDSVLSLIKFYTPSYKPELYIPGVLNEVVAAPEEDDIILVTYKYSDVDPAIDFKQVGNVPVIQENFTNEADGFGSFTAFSVTGDQTWEWASYGDGCAVMTGFVNPDRFENEDWLVSSEYDLSDYEEVSLSFKHALNYNDEDWDRIKVFISEDYDGSSNPTEQGTWTELTIPNIPFTESWDFVSSGDIDISSYAGSKVYVAFQYTSTTTTAGTWEIGNVSISIPGVPVTGKAPLEYNDYFVYTTDGWVKETGVYFVNKADYNEMGPGTSYGNFSASAKPQDYLPNLLKAKYPLAGEEKEVVTVYKYYNSVNRKTSVLADKYTYEDGEWVSSYNFITVKTDQFLVANDNKWVFDPTITYVMASADYQIVVDNVKAEYGDEYIDSYGTQEFYTGAGSYYANYDVREGKFDKDVFGTWQEAVIYSIGELFLPTKYPDAQTTVDGVDMYYIVQFQTYSGSYGTYNIKYQVTKSGPEPEFTYVEGPF